MYKNINDYQIAEENQKKKYGEIRNYGVKRKSQKKIIKEFIEIRETYCLMKKMILFKKRRTTKKPVGY